MSNIIEKYVKKKEYLVCVDSDGCAMDTMDVKHFRCFGPCMIREWKLEQWKEETEKRWNDVNLYTMTRGINRFKALEAVLRWVDGHVCKIEGLEDLAKWTDTAKELSPANLMAAIEAGGGDILKKAFDWSAAVNREIDALPESEKLPFEGVKETLAMIHEKADIVVVSSANAQAVAEEWQTHGLAGHTDLMLSQDAGSKQFCINELLKKGYQTDHVLMVGDASGDRSAARNNGVLYYPILVKKETYSWKRLQEEGMKRFLTGTFKGEYERQLEQEFEDNLTPKTEQ